MAQPLKHPQSESGVRVLHGPKPAGTCQLQPAHVSGVVTLHVLQSPVQLATPLLRCSDVFHVFRESEYASHIWSLWTWKSLRKTVQLVHC